MKSEIEAPIFIPRFCFNDRRIPLFSVILVKNERTQKKQREKFPLFLFKSRQNEIFEPEGPQTLPPGDAGRSTMLLSWIDNCATHQPEAQVLLSLHAPPLGVEPTVR